MMGIGTGNRGQEDKGRGRSLGANTHNFCNTGKMEVLHSISSDSNPYPSLY